MCIPTLSAGNHGSSWSHCHSHRPGAGSHLLQPLLCNPEGWIGALAACLGRWFQFKALEAHSFSPKYHLFPFSHAGNLALTQSSPSKNPWLILAIQGQLTPLTAGGRSKKSFLHQGLFSLFVPVRQEPDFNRTDKNKPSHGQSQLCSPLPRDGQPNLQLTAI